jgi:hypothetical protein
MASVFVGQLSKGSPRLFTDSTKEDNFRSWSYWKLNDVPDAKWSQWAQFCVGGTGPYQEGG